MKNLRTVLFVFGIFSVCGFIANGVFWYWQQVFPNISFNVVLGGGMAGLIGFGIGATVVFISQQQKRQQPNKSTRKK